MRHGWCTVAVLSLAVPGGLAMMAGRAAATSRALRAPPAASAPPAAPALDAMLGAFTGRPLLDAPIAAHIGGKAACRSRLARPHGAAPHCFQDPGASTVAAAATRSSQLRTFCTAA